MRKRPKKSPRTKKTPADDKETAAIIQVAEAIADLRRRVDALECSLTRPNWMTPYENLCGRTYSVAPGQYDLCSRAFAHGGYCGP